MASAELEKRKREEYEMQLFGFHSRAVYATLKSVVESKIKSRCQHLYDAIANKYKLDEEGKTILKENVKELKRTYMERAQPHLENIKGIVEKFIAIPDNVLLPEDKCQAVQYSDEEFKALNDRLEDLRKTLKRAHILGAVLDKELAATKGVDPFVNSVTKVFDVMEKALDYPEFDREIIHAIERLQALTITLNTPPKTEKDIYNPNIDHIQLEEVDIADLTLDS